MKVINALFARTGRPFAQLLRYVVVGGAAFAVDFAVLYLLTDVGGLHYLVSACLAFTAGLVANYALSVTWVFDQRRVGNRAHEFAIFAMVGIVGLGLNAALMWFFTELAGLHYLGSKAVAAVVIFLFNFGARRSLLFSPRQP